MSRKHTVDEVIRSLTYKKGCIITTDRPITKSVERIELPNTNTIAEAYKKYLDKNILSVQIDLVSIGEIKANEKWFNQFKKVNPRLFATRTYREIIVIQSPFTINIHEAHELGNGSWGKIDFLTNHAGFSLMR